MKQTATARKLRNNLTEAEKNLWYILRAENLKHKFRRQAQIGLYIVDFVCYEKNLIIEIDGGQHYESSEDKIRDSWLNSQGFTVLRFWNNEVLQNRGAVVEKIIEHLNNPLPNPPHKGEGIHKSQAGFTLIELLLYLGLAAVLLLVISIFLALILRSRVKNQTVSEVESQGAMVMNLVMQTIRNAESINSPALGASAASLSLDAAGAGNDPTVFDLASGILRIQEGAGSAVPITSSRLTATGINFQNLSRAATPGTVRVQFTLTHLNPSAKNEYDYSKTFYGSASLR